MLVLTRKIDEQILIGEDIKVTLLRVRGNTVRIGIEAPREVRVLRGELDAAKENTEDDLLGGGPQVADSEQPFAHPIDREPKHNPVNRMTMPTQPKIFVGSVKRSGEDAQLSPAPLAGFVSAT